MTINPKRDCFFKHYVNPHVQFDRVRMKINRNNNLPIALRCWQSDVSRTQLFTATSTCNWNGDIGTRFCDHGQCTRIHVQVPDARWKPSDRISNDRGLVLFFYFLLSVLGAAINKGGWVRRTRNKMTAGHRMIYVINTARSSHTRALMLTRVRGRRRPPIKVENIRNPPPSPTTSFHGLRDKVSATRRAPGRRRLSRGHPYTMHARNISSRADPSSLTFRRSVGRTDFVKCFVRIRQRNITREKKKKT